MVPGVFREILEADGGGLFVLLQAFSKKKVDDRKEWLTNFMEDRRQRRMHGLPEVCVSTQLFPEDVYYLSNTPCQLKTICLEKTN